MNEQETPIEIRIRRKAAGKTRSRQADIVPILALDNTSRNAERGIEVRIFSKVGRIGVKGTEDALLKLAKECDAHELKAHADSIRASVEDEHYEQERTLMLSKSWKRYLKTTEVYITAGWEHTGIYRQTVALNAPYQEGARFGKRAAHQVQHPGGILGIKTEEFRSPTDWFFVCKPGWHETLEEAKAQVERERVQRIAELEQQIVRLKTLDFTADGLREQEEALKRKKLTRLVEHETSKNHGLTSPDASEPETDPA